MLAKLRLTATTVPPVSFRVFGKIHRRAVKSNGWLQLVSGQLLRAVERIGHTGSQRVAVHVVHAGQRVGGILQSLRFEALFEKVCAALVLQNKCVRCSDRFRCRLRMKYAVSLAIELGSAGGRCPRLRILYVRLRVLSQRQCGFQAFRFDLLHGGL
ncbi:hypothetical protein Q31a_15120 [Aureliella helgolandensis]|uniref:Uncharacterized protein n=1 Tax=Aureliella helgolandensis TaxID=2527968 RepID=A0A518G3P4_9BACT|nr:hypothetical protein Q31a_15120 [Aureliella helgolandensis]